MTPFSDEELSLWITSQAAKLDSQSSGYMLDDNETTVTDYAEAAGLSRMGASGRLRRLEAAGLMTSRMETIDGRRTRVYRREVKDG